MERIIKVVITTAVGEKVAGVDEEVVVAEVEVRAEVEEMERPKMQVVGSPPKNGLQCLITIRITYETRDLNMQLNENLALLPPLLLMMNPSTSPKRKLSALLTPTQLVIKCHAEIVT